MLTPRVGRTARAESMDFGTSAFTAVKEISVPL
jgi:hypothetical protein